MNNSKLKTYAPAARKEFMRAVTERAAYLGLSKGQIEPAEVKGEIALIGGRAFPKEIIPQREKLEKRIQEEGFDLVMESVAYTWFNRMPALRYMELHGYLDHGFRVLSHPNGGHIPEILEQAAHVELPGLNHDQVVEMKLEGTKDPELYRMLFIAQCNALHQAMPFLFEAIQDETELLLPDNLLHTNSLLQKLVKEIPEEDWQEVVIIGWIYQFYISEKKDQVFEGLKKNKKITPENIPAATQLFTPHWIVRYLAENSLGRLWMLNRPKSRLVERMDYYIKPEQEETDFLRINKPEELKICDPACGSGHMLVYSFDLLYAIYEEEGYAPAEIPEKILAHNLYGIEIDERAGELAAFALTMKARAKQRGFFRKPVQPNICVLKKIQFEEGDLKNYMDFVGRDLFTAPLQTTLCQFEEADNFGSLIRPEVTDLEGIFKILESKNVSENLFLNRAHQKVLEVLKQADYLSPKYHVVIANPPYMGSKGMNGRLKTWLNDNYPDVKSDLFSAFIERNLDLTENQGSVAMITMQSWMFLSSFEKLRNRLLGKDTILSMAHLGARAFDSISGEVVSTTAFVLENDIHLDYKGSYLRLVDGNSEAEKEAAIREAIKNPDCGWYYHASVSDFKKIPGNPIAYWISEKMRMAFINGVILSEVAEPKKGITTSDNDKYLRLWHEVKQSNFDCSVNKLNSIVGSKMRWFPVNKGGGYRKWYGNKEVVIDWLDNGASLKSFENSVIRNSSYYFREGMTWNDISSGKSAMRYSSGDAMFEGKGPMAFARNSRELRNLISFFNSKVSASILSPLRPTLNFNIGEISKTPIIPELLSFFETDSNARSCISFAQSDWNSYETSWDFTNLPLIQSDYRQSTLEASYHKLRAHWRDMTLEMQRLEEENNHIFIDTYDLQDELTPEVSLNEITLTCNPQYRYGSDKSEEELEELLLADTIKELISYALGCMMGRYSLDQTGLVYADSGNEGFDLFKYNTFPADDDGIVPITDLDWFPDDATNRFVEFIRVAWSPETLEENLRFIANSLLPKSGEIPRETIRRYFSTAFFKDHLKTYKKRPIYWLFSSGKERAFQCLVYLHRYNESTLSRMRNEYVIPLQGKLASRTEHLDQEVQSATSTAQQNKFRKQLDGIKKKQQELTKFDEELRHYADKRIHLDLDDGVKVNYQRFGNLLAEI